MDKNEVPNGNSRENKSTNGGVLIDGHFSPPENFIYIVQDDDQLTTRGFGQPLMQPSMERVIHRNITCDQTTTLPNHVSSEAPRDINTGEATRTLESRIKNNENKLDLITTSLQNLITKVDQLNPLKDKHRSKPANSHSTAQTTSTRYDAESDSDSDNAFFGQSIVSDSDEDESREGKTTLSGNDKLVKLKSASDQLDGGNDFGPKLNESITSMVNKSVNKNYDVEKGKKQCEIVKIPENCKMLAVPKINEELWNDDVLDKKLRMQDCLFQTTQNYVGKAMVPMLKLMDLLLEQKSEESTTWFNLAFDSVNMLTFAHRDLTNVRRKMIKPGLKPEFRKFCQPQVEVTENLLGENLSERVKTVNEMKKLGKTMSSGGHKPYPRKRSSETQSLFRGERKEYHQNAYSSYGPPPPKRHYQQTGTFLPKRALPQGKTHAYQKSRMQGRIQKN